jgi:peptidoglycan/xylan/chitin deacetylase (PgdA/CDA1 family)
MSWAQAGSRRVTIVMYHYVRDLRRSAFPRIKALDLAAFRAQLDFLSRHYTAIRAGDLIGALKHGDPLPPRALLLTFDDGYAEHFTEVMPLLEARRWQGCFFPVADAVTGHRVLDVNKLHFILAATTDAGALASHVLGAVEANGARLGLDPPDVYRARCGTVSRYDPPDVTFVKRMLQRELPESFRAGLIDELFRAHVTRDEASFAAELYVSAAQLGEMVDRGMYVGSHGCGHYWMDTLTPAEQAREIDASLAFLRSVGAATSDWIMCYPYGGFNASLLDIVRQRGCAAGLAVTVGVADLSADDPLTLPRLDTNDLPAAAGAPAGTWTAQA